MGRRTNDGVESKRENDWKRNDDQPAKAEAEPGVVAVSVLQAKVIALQMKGRLESSKGFDLCIPRNEIVRPHYFQNRILMFCLPISTFMYLCTMVYS